MTPIQKAFLKAGWIQVGGADIPVFFKYNPYPNPKYPFHIIFTVDDNAYYQLYNHWVVEGKLLAENIHIDQLIGPAYEHMYVTAELFHVGIMYHISDYYFHKRDMKERMEYEDVIKHLETLHKEKGGPVSTQLKPQILNNATRETQL